MRRRIPAQIEESVICDENGVGLRSSKKQSDTAMTKKKNRASFLSVKRAQGDSIGGFLEDIKAISAIIPKG